MALVGMNLKYNLVLAPCHWQSFQALNQILEQVTKGHTQPPLEQIQGRGIHTLFGQKKRIP